MTLAISQSEPLQMRMAWHPRSPVGGMLYHLWLRLKWITLGTLAAILVAAIALRVLPEPIASDLVPPATVLLCLFPMIFMIMPMTYSGKDVGARESAFPPYMLVLPVRTSMLVRVPMLCAACIAAGIWALLYVLIFSRSLPPYAFRWLATAFVGAILWTQALAWVPFWFSFLRVLAGAIAIFSVIAAGICGLGENWFDLHWNWIYGIYVAFIVSAYPLAVGGLSRARRGDGTRPAWLRASTGPSRRRARQPFPSAERAQVWYEFRRNALLLPLFSMILPVLFISLTPLMQLEPYEALGRPFHPALVLIVLAFIAPIFFARVHGTAMGKSDFWAKPISVSSFIAVRPISCGRIIRAKIMAGAVAVVVSYAVVLLLSAIWFWIPNSFGGGKSIAAYLAANFTPRWAAICIGFLLLFMADALKSLTQGMFLAAFGRPWLSNALIVRGIFNGLALIALIYELARSAWFRHVGSLAMPYLIYAMTLAAIAFAAIVLQACRRAGVLTGRQTRAITIAWGCASIALAVELLHTPAIGFASKPLLVSCAILFFPVAKIALAPLALHFNRHR